MDGLGKRKLLIVDDNSAYSNMLTHLLRTQYQTICAANGKLAVQLAKSSCPDLILLDIMMPEMDGYQVCRKLKQNEQTKDIPIIFLTAKNAEKDKIKGLENGAVDYISKPVDPVVLEHKIRIHMELKCKHENIEALARARTKEITKSNDKLNKEISQRTQIQQALVEQKAYFSQLFENFSEAIMILAPDGKILDVNKGFEKIFGYKADEVKDKYSSHLVVPEDMIPEDVSFLRNILAGKMISKETIRVQKNGNYIPVFFQGYPAKVNDRIEGVFMIYRDISKRKKFEAELFHKSFYDSLTGIPNRILLMERLERAVERYKRRRECRFSLLMVDINHFKNVNDRLGTPVGDEYLMKFSQKIKKCIRSTDTIARMGGDVFAILVEEFNSPREVFKIARRVHKAGKSTFVIQGKNIRNSVSIGVVLKTDKYQQADHIIRDADIALYSMKEQPTSKACFRVFKEKMHKVTVDSLKMQNDLRNAILDNKLILHYQPIFFVSDQRLVGFEALVRWQHHTKGLVGPNKFIPLAEETDLIVPLGQLVLEKACRQLKEWHDYVPGAEDLTMNVNISTKQFMQSDLPSFVMNVLEENELDPGFLNLEITESLLAKKAKAMIYRLNSLKNHGINIVLDDFGTGYSSLSYIQDFEIDCIKIDRSFINEIDSDAGSVEIVETIIALCKKLGLYVVAEGVERDSQLSLLNDLGCGQVQGFYFSHPVDAYTAVQIIEKNLRIPSKTA
ncbi:MAG: EAL domain-containing protein [Desulfobacteraceae bacterium]|nr:EAL domain-containing protein [Desulfobacteraceae bacterium]